MNFTLISIKHPQCEEVSLGTMDEGRDVQMHHNASVDSTEWILQSYIVNDYNSI